MKVLITGINGFIGKHLANKLIEEGESVFGLGTSEICATDGVNGYFSGDVLNAEVVAKAMEDIDVVIHLAALTAHSDIVDNKNKTLEVNLLGTKNILDSFSKSEKAQKFIYASTGKVYGEIEKLPLDEKHPTQPLNILGKSKLITERLIDFYDNKKKEYIIFRIFNVFGEEQKDSFLLPTILNQLKDGKKSDEKKIKLGDTKAQRDYIHIDDVVSAFVLATNVELEKGLSIFNICSGKPRSAGEMVEEISRIMGVTVNVDVDEKLYRKDEVDIEYSSYEKAKKVLGWEPERDLYSWLKSKVNPTK